MKLMASARFLLVLTAMSVGTFAWAQRAVTVTVTGNQITGTGIASVMLASQGNENAAGFSVTFDPAVLRYNSYANGADSSGATVNVNAAQATSGRIGVVLALSAGSSYAAGNRELVKVNFTVLASASRSTNLGFGNTPVGQEVSNNLAEILPATFTGLTIAANPAPTAPTITTQPEDKSVTVGPNVVFTVGAAGAPPLTYQWSKDGRAIAGATNATLALTAVTGADAGSYRVVVANGAGTVQSRVATLVVNPPVSKIINLSVRTGAGTGSETLIAGFVVAGQGAAKPMLVRGIGPSLAAFGVTDVLADPALELYRDTIKVAENDNWGDSLDVDQIGQAMVAAGAFPIAERGRDAALLVRLQPGNYSAQVSARAGTGIALIELYDTESVAASTRLANVSARSSVGTGAGVLIAGFIIQGDTAKTVLVRGIGPTLATFGVTDVLADPQLTLNRGNEVIATNDEWWRSGGLQALPPVFAAVGAFTLENGTHDAALVATLAPGNYTATLSGVEGATGVALLEVYEVP